MSLNGYKSLPITSSVRNPLSGSRSTFDDCAIICLHLSAVAFYSSYPIISYFIPIFWAALSLASLSWVWSCCVNRAFMVWAHNVHGVVVPCSWSSYCVCNGAHPSHSSTLHFCDVVFAWYLPEMCCSSSMIWFRSHVAAPHIQCLFSR